MESTRAIKVLTGTTIAAGILGVTAVAFAAAGGSARSAGPDRAYGEANPFAAASAVVHVVRTGNDSSHVSLAVHDVNALAGRTFGAHVHTQPCGVDPLAAGGHYQHAGATGSLEAREVWLDVTIDADGNGTSHAKRPWAVDQATPRSVIIHALPTNADTGAAGARLACIDLDGQHH
jgi:Cu/Zn superoxide dismutase